MPLTRQQFINKYWSLAVALCKGTGLFPEILLSQAIIESQGEAADGNYYPGESKLAKVYNNYFGIKTSKTWKGETVNLKTGEVYDGSKVIVDGTFRVYKSIEDSMKDYILFLKINPRYTNAGLFTAKSPAEQAKILQKAGYATNPDYASMVANLALKVKELAKNLSKGAGPIALILLSIITYKIFK